MVGGRNLGGARRARRAFHPGDRRPARSQQWTASPDPGFFLHDWLLPSGALDGRGLRATQHHRPRRPTASARPVRAAVEQFDAAVADCGGVRRSAPAGTRWSTRRSRVGAGTGRARRPR